MPKERNKADDYREKAYAGDTKAMNNLGVCYERGTGVKVSLELAFEWYMKAAELDDVYGCFNVGECYYHGKGVEQSVADRDSSLRVHIALHALEEPYREVFELRVFGELSFRDIGMIFSKTENWARVTYHRARLKLQERMLPFS